MDNIVIEIKPIGEMRYPTVGDYYLLPDGRLKFDIADTGNPIYNQMVLIHELIECTILQHRGVPLESIDRFDYMFEGERARGLHAVNDEPGFDARSPYASEHALATAVEMMMCAMASINWNQYNKTIEDL